MGRFLTVTFVQMFVIWIMYFECLKISYSSRLAFVLALFRSASFRAASQSAFK